MRAVTAEIAWHTRLFSELQVPCIQPIPVKCDSLAAIYIAKNPVFHERTKHIELDCHFVGEKLHEGLISLFHTLRLLNNWPIYSLNLLLALNTTICWASWGFPPIHPPT